jgi:AcrR family transcriptional regulator
VSERSLTGRWRRNGRHRDIPNIGGRDPRGVSSLRSHSRGVPRQKENREGLGDGDRSFAGKITDNGSVSARERLIDATERLLRQGGLAAVTTQSVARAAGLAEGTIYRHFDCRDGLLAETIRERLPAELEHHIEELIASAGQGEVERNLVTFLSAVMPLFKIIAPLSGMLAAHPPLATRYYQRLREEGRGPRHAHDRLEVYFREEQRLGRMRAGIDARAAAALMIGVCFHRSFLTQLFGEEPTGLSDSEIPTALAAILACGVEQRTSYRKQSQRKGTQSCAIAEETSPTG